MKNSLNEHSLLVLEQMLGCKRAKRMDDAKLVEFLARKVQELMQKADFMEAMCNEAARKADSLFYEYNAAKSLHNKLYLEHEKLLLDFEKLKSEAESEKVVLERSYSSVITGLKAQLYDEIGSRFAGLKSG